MTPVCHPVTYIYTPQVLTALHQRIRSESRHTLDSTSHRDAPRAEWLVEKLGELKGELLGLLSRINLDYAARQAEAEATALRLDQAPSSPAMYYAGL